MIEIEKPRIEAEDLLPDGSYGKFSIEPLERGYGITLGNSLRRVLLSSLPGVAVTSIKIDGIVHEFTTLPDVKEDVTEIILNIKKLRAKLYGDGPKVVYIEAVGPCEVTAGSIKADSEVEILDPDMHIATLSEGGKLYMELVLDRKLQEKRVFPAIDIVKSGTRREDLLLNGEEREAVYIMRRALNGMKAEEAAENILNLFARTRTNQELVSQVRKQKFI